MHPFENLTIIELASVLAGPSVGQFFAELGATVIKVENPALGGDVTRKWKVPAEKVKDGRSAYFCSANWGKKSVWLDLTNPSEKEKLFDLLKTADVLLSSFKPGDAEKFGLDYNTLHGEFPQLIHASVNGWGEANSRVAYDALIQAEAGFTFMNGTPESGPVKMPVALMDILAAHQLKEAILIALLRRKETNLGEKVSISLYDAAVSSLANQGLNYLQEGHIPKRIGNEHPNICPYGTVFYTADQQPIVLAVGSDQQFERLCKVLAIWENPEMENYLTNAKRVSNRNQLLNLLSKAISTWQAETLLQKLHEKVIPAGKVKSMDQVFETPEAQKLVMQKEGYFGIRQLAAKIGNEKGLELDKPPGVFDDGKTRNL